MHVCRRPCLDKIESLTPLSLILGRLRNDLPLGAGGRRYCFDKDITRSVCRALLAPTFLSIFALSKDIGTDVTIKHARRGRHNSVKYDG